MELYIYLRRKAASTYLKETHGIERAPSTLAKLAVIGGGPPFRRLNRAALYDPVDLDQWVASKLSPLVRSTSDNGGRAMLGTHTPTVTSAPGKSQVDPQ
jgi:hypothetical protein